ncbi:hypothetical protein HSZ49_09295 [Staphylococcus saprophyticus]|uniref:hypothetical protein n=1 Tax=Staphylococcus saprophyticus TaxID=29385 RepID=UPI00157D5D16|nr:hypothetical protein [Staphylococcus saprophyticus]QKQ06011.1 hypothetical protein HSZ49_09295 [Staphylococcus saprophyticus]
MDKEILNYLDKVGKYLQGAGEKGFETYVHGVFVQSLIYTIVGALLLCLATTLIIVGWKLFTKKVYVTVPEREEFSPFAENKRRIIPEHQKRDDEAEEINLYIAGIMGIVSTFLVMFGIAFVVANITGVFAPDYVAIKEIAENIGGK